MIVAISFDADHWGTFWDLVQGVGTVLAFGAVIGQLRSEARRHDELRRDELDERVKRQARLVSAWVSYEVGEWDEVAEEPVYMVNRVYVRNGSTEPVYRVNVADAGGRHHGSWDVMAPATTASVKVPNEVDECQVWFVDSAAIEWIRQADGRLQQVESGPS